MKSYTKTLLPLLILTLFLCKRAEALIQLTYTIEVNVDGSATWIIEQKGMGIPPPVFDEFVRNVSLLIAAAAEKTQRNMTAESLSMSVNVSGSYKIIRYRFTWNNFAQITNEKIIIGDAFQVKNLFSYLYGDGTVCILYPSEFIVESVSPQPHERNDQIYTLEWYGTADFKTGEPEVVLVKSLNPWINKAIILIVGSVILYGGFIAIYYFKFRRKKAKGSIDIQKIESDEEKVIRVIRRAGGSLYQSAIADQCKFSRAKASKLLKIMEDKGLIKREIKGREKIVILVEGKK